MKIKSSETMKILGFVFGSRPTADAHIASIKTKFRRRLWLLRNLKRSNLNSKDLTDAYTCFLRPILEYCSNVFHSMLNLTQSNEIEKLQKNALKMIFGYDYSYTDLLEMSNLTTLHERRDRLFDKFSCKLRDNPRFRSIWLPERTFTGYDLREEQIFDELRAKTERRRKGPLFEVRRRLNNL